MPENDYDRGYRAAQQEAVRAVQKAHEERLNLHSARLGRLERWFAMMAGFLLALQALPIIKAVFETLQ